MANITVYMKDGTKQEFLHKGRAGGSYTPEIKYEGSFAVITDEWSNVTAIPVNEIKYIETKPIRSW